MDGLLVDTEPTWFAAETRLLAEFGYELGSEHAEQLLGKPIEYSAAYLREVSGLDLDPATLQERLNTRMAKLLSEGVPWRPGASELLGALVAAGVRCALVSASHRVVVDAVLASLAEDRFAFTVAHDDVTMTKPDPEPYLLAARRMGVEPGDCVVFEDSPTGVRSAEAAGCRVIAVPGALPIEPAPGRTVIASLTEVGLTDSRIV